MTMPRKDMLPFQLEDNLSDSVTKLLNSNDDESVVVLGNLTVAEVATYVCAMANTRSGYILVGFEKGFGTTVVGSNIKQKSELEILLQGASFDFEICKYRLLFDVVVITVHYSEDIAYVDSGAYVLEGGQLKAMSKKSILNKMGLGLSSELLNTMAGQLNTQTQKIDDLTLKLVESQT